MNGKPDPKRNGPRSPIAPTFWNQMLTPVLKLSCLIVFIITIVTLPANWQSQNWAMMILEIASFLWLLLSAFIESIPYRTRSEGYLVILYAFGVYTSVMLQPAIDNKIILACLIVAATIFRGRRMGLITTILSCATVVILGWITNANRAIAFPGENGSLLTAWLINSILFISISGVILAILGHYIRIIEGEIKVQNASQIRHLTKIEEMDYSLKKMAREFLQSEEVFESNSTFIKQFTSDTPPEETLQKIVQMVQEQFSYYFVGGYIVDEKKEFAILKAATSKDNESYLQQNLRIKLTDASVVSYAFNHAEVRLSPNIPEETNFNTYPLLPGTKSELALPLIHNGEVIGIIDIQNDQLSAFSPLELKVLKIYADQATILYVKSCLQLQLLKSQEELENSYKQYTQKSWRSYLRQSRQKMAVRYRQGILEKEMPQSVEVLQAIAEGKPVIITQETIPTSRRATSSVTMPIKLRNQVIGAVHFTLESRQLPDDWMLLIETISDRLAVALENARLLEEIQTRANREHLVGEISSKIRSSPNVDQVLRTAVSEIGKKLGVDEVMIHLRSDQ